MASPQTRTVEIDLSRRPPGFQGLTGLAIGNFDKGPVGPDDRIFISSQQESDIVLGRPGTGSDVAYYIIHSYLTRSSRLWVRRVVKNAMFGGIYIASSFNEEIGVGDASNLVFAGTFQRCHPATVTVWIDNSKIGYDNGSGVIFGDNVDDTVSTIDYETGVFNVEFLPGFAPPDGATVYMRHHPTINRGFTAGFLPGSYYAFTSPTTYNFQGPQLSQKLVFSGFAYDDTLIPGSIVPPEDPDYVDFFTMGPVTVEGPGPTLSNDPIYIAGQATVTIFDGTLAVAYVDELGDIKETVSVAGMFLDLAANPTPSLSYASGVIDFDIQSTYTVISSGLTVVYQSYKSYLFMIHADNPGEWADGFQVLIQNISIPDNAFEINVEQILQFNAPDLVDTFTVSREHKQDGFLRQMYIEERINDNSFYIRTHDNLNVGELEAIPHEFVPHTITNELTIQEMIMEGGVNGTIPTVTDYIIALNTFNNKEDITINIVIDTLGDPDYGNAIIQLCDRDLGGRGDCYGILHVPFTVEQTTNFVNDTVNYRKYTLKTSSSWAGLYFGHVLIKDTYNGRDIFIPPSGFVASVFSFTADQFEPWFAAAGWQRGVLPVKDVFRRLTLGQRDVFYDNQINAIRFKPGRGIAVWGQRTLQAFASALDRANVRWVLIVIENAIEAYLDENTFEFNDFITRAILQATCFNYLGGIKIRRGLYDFDVVCDASNNSNEDIDNNKLNLDYYVQPTKVAEFMKGRAIITRTGVSFSEVRIQ